MKMLSYTFREGRQDKLPLILLHGFLESSSMWEHIAFPENQPLLLIDLPGHGQSKDIQESCESIREMANAVLQVLDHLELKQFDIIGHSMGGYVALEAKYLDERVGKVMLLNSNFWSDSPQKVKDRIRVADIVQTNKSHFIYEVIPNLFINPEEQDERVKSLISEALEMSATAIASASIAMSKRKNHTDFVRANSSSFYCIQGEQDPIVSAEQMRGLAKDAQFDYFELEGIGHMAHIEAPFKVNELVDFFLREVL